jgi:predicted RNase H-like HicB family nuclease
MKVRDVVRMVEQDGEARNRTIAGHLSKDLDPKTIVYSETGRAQGMKYTVLIEKTGNGYSAHVPDLPGCIAAGDTYEETLELMREAIEFHIEGMRLHGETVPKPATRSEEIEVGAA